jgi:hypothetical protein
LINSIYDEYKYVIQIEFWFYLIFYFAPLLINIMALEKETSNVGVSILLILGLLVQFWLAWVEIV